MFEMKSRFCVAVSILSICQQLSTTVTATKSSLIRSNRILADGSVSFDPIDTLGGPYPNGWVNSTNVDDQANLAYDLGAMYEVEDSDGKNDVYKNVSQDLFF